MLVSRVPNGSLYVVSDSEVNVELFYKKRSVALGSATGDLFRLLFDYLDCHPVRLKLYWVPGHMDKDVSKRKHHVPDYHFLLNHVADSFAERAAKSVELEMNVVSGVLWYSSLVQKIQRRMVRVIISLVQKASFDKRHPTPKPHTPSLDDIIQASQHQLVEAGHTFRCLQCSGSVSRHAHNVKDWLKAKCDVALYADSEKHVPVPRWHLVKIGNSIPHVSHELFSLKGIIFCMKCGSFGAKRCRLLVHECKKMYN